MQIAFGRRISLRSCLVHAAGVDSAMRRHSRSESNVSIFETIAKVF
jgi:hypothetical protein